MRIFMMVFGGLLAVGLIVVGFWFGYEKAVMGVATYGLRNDVAELRKLQKNDASGSMCNDFEDDNQLVGYQLRFVSETDYVLEAVCGSLDQTRVLKASSLPGGVHRLYGAGMLLPVGENQQEMINGWVHLVYKDTVTAVGYFDDIPSIKWDAQSLPIGGDDIARANCADWGFFCCKDGSESGEGAQINTNDCLQNCFQKCNQQPVIVYFNSDPIIDPQARLLILYAQSANVDFGYEIIDFDGSVENVTLDFGDGEIQKNLGDREELISHEYACDQLTCVYQARLTAVDVEGNDVVESDLNQITVILEPQQ